MIVPCDITTLILGQIWRLDKIYFSMCHFPVMCCLIGRTLQTLRFDVFLSIYHIWVISLSHESTNTFRGNYTYHSIPFHFCCISNIFPHEGLGNKTWQKLKIDWPEILT